MPMPATANSASERNAGRLHPVSQSNKETNFGLAGLIGRNEHVVRAEVPVL